MQPQNQNLGEQPVQPVQPAAPAPVPTPAPVAPVAQPAQAPAAAPVQPAPEQSTTPQPQASAAPLEEGEEEVLDEDVEYIDEEEQEYDDEEPVDLSEPVTWQAQEFVHQEKSNTWFIAFGVAIAVMMAVAIFLMKSPTFAVLLVVIAVVIVVLAKRPPRLMSYSLSEKGLHIGDTLHAFSEFRAFGIIHDGQEYSVMLIPTKRFLPGITVYFPEESGEKIVDALGSRLPMQDLRLDVVDKIVRKLRLG